MEKGSREKGGEKRNLLGEQRWREGKERSQERERGR